MLPLLALSLESRRGAGGESLFTARTILPISRPVGVQGDGWRGGGGEGDGADNFSNEGVAPKALPGMADWDGVVPTASADSAINDLCALFLIAAPSDVSIISIKDFVVPLGFGELTGVLCGGSRPSRRGSFFVSTDRPGRL